MSTMATERKHLSATQLDMYCRCPESYRRRYIEGEVIPPGIALAKGKGLHAGAETNMRQKIASFEDLPASDIVDASVAAFEAEIAGGIALDSAEASIGASIVVAAAKDAVAEMAQVHADEQAPEYQPILVEETVRFELPGPRDLLGIIDLATDDGKVVDFKTARRKKKQGDADDSVQLSIYAAAYERKTGTPPDRVRLDVLVQGSKGITRQVLDSSRGAADMDALANRINVISSAIESGIFPPAPPGAWNCSRRWCGFFDSCIYVNSERVSLAERNEE